MRQFVKKGQNEENYKSIGLPYIIVYYVFFRYDS